MENTMSTVVGWLAIGMLAIVTVLLAGMVAWCLKLMFKREPKAQVPQGISTDTAFIRLRDGIALSQRVPRVDIHHIWDIVFYARQDRGYAVVSWSLGEDSEYHCQERWAIERVGQNDIRVTSKL